MRSRVFVSAACLAFLIPFGTVLAQEALRPEAAYQAAASAAVRDGNVASARQEALAAALCLAVQRAALDLIGPQGGLGQLRDRLTRPESYVLSYRVVFETEVGGWVEAAPLPEDEEGLAAQDAAEGESVVPLEERPETYYCVRVEALVSLAALKRNLRAQGLLGAEELLPQVTVSVEEVAGDVSARRAEEMLVAALRQGGFKVQTPSWWFRRQSPGELSVAARLRSLCSAGGCSGEAWLEGRDNDQPKAQAAGTGAGQTGEEALSAALAAAVGSLATEVVALQQQVSVLLSLKGLLSYGELAQIKAALDEMGLAGRERSLRPQEIVLEVGLVGGPESLASRLLARQFDGFGLVRAPSAPDTLALEVIHPAEPPAPKP